jgi:histidinol-phosphate aminotransferase
VPYSGDREDPQALIAAAIETGAKLIYFANPDNPMGSWHDAATVQAMIDALPEGAVLALDEAYSDTAPDGAIPPLDLTHPRVIRFRTFSKAYGLAGLRVGYGLATPTSPPPSTASATISASAAWRRPVRWPRSPIRVT